MSLVTLRIQTAALFTLAGLLWPTAASGQHIPAPPVEPNQAFDTAPGATEDAQSAAVRVTARVYDLIMRFDHGANDQVASAAAALQNQPGLASGSRFRFRVGMFFEDITLNMLRLFSTARAGRGCDPALRQAVDAELSALEAQGLGKGVVFGRKAFNKSC